eukprot:5001605-Amphidinium_carterae.1
MAEKILHQRGRMAGAARIGIVALQSIRVDHQHSWKLGIRCCAYAAATSVATALANKAHQVGRNVRRIRVVTSDSIVDGDCSTIE